MTLIHDRQSVQALQQAYADKTECFFTGLKQIPGNPCQVQIRRFGSIRTCIAHGHDWLNRATVSGDESFDLIDDIIAHYARQGERLHVEWNPGNCHRPGSWNGELGVAMLARGFQPGGFRCVWHADVSTDIAPRGSEVQLRHFGPGEREELVTVLIAMEEKTTAEKEEMKTKFLFGQNSKQWYHYVG